MRISVIDSWCDLRLPFPAPPGSSRVGLLGQPDTIIWDYAARQGFVVVSKDDDFRQLSFFRGHPPKVIWLVVGNAGTDFIAELLLQSKSLIASFVGQTEDALLTLSSSSNDLA